MKGLAGILVAACVLLFLALAALPSAAAHDCEQWSCGECHEGEAHDHNDWRGHCVSSASLANLIPGPPLAMVVGLLAVAALLVRARQG